MRAGTVLRLHVDMFPAVTLVPPLDPYDKPKTGTGVLDIKLNLSYLAVLLQALHTALCMLIHGCRIWGQ